MSCFAFQPFCWKEKTWQNCVGISMTCSRTRQQSAASPWQATTVYIYFIWAHTDLGDNHFLVGSIDADDPLTQIEDHGTHHPLPGLEKRKILENVWWSYIIELLIRSKQINDWNRPFSIKKNVVQKEYSQWTPCSSPLVGFQQTLVQYSGSRFFPSPQTGRHNR